MIVSFLAPCSSNKRITSVEPGTGENMNDKKRNNYTFKLHWNLTFTKIEKLSIKHRYYLMWWKLYFDRQSLLKKHEDCLTIVLPQCKRISLNPRATLIWVRNFFKIIDPKTYKLPTKWQNGLTKISVSACNFTKKFFSQ